VAFSENGKKIRQSLGRATKLQRAAMKSKLNKPLTTKERLPLPWTKQPITKPNTIKAWTIVFSVGRNCMSKMLRDQAIRNKKLTRSSYQILIDDLPEIEKAKHRSMKPTK